MGPFAREPCNGPVLLPLEMRVEMEYATGFVMACALMVAFIAGSRRRVSRTSAEAATGQYPALTRQLEWNGTYARAFQRVLDLFQALDAQITAADPNRGAIEARSSISPLVPVPISITLRATLTTRDGVTLVHIDARPSSPLLGRRRAALLLAQISDAWDRLPGPRSP